MCFNMLSLFYKDNPCKCSEILMFFIFLRFIHFKGKVTELGRETGRWTDTSSISWLLSQMAMPNPGSWNSTCLPHRSPCPKTFHLLQLSEVSSSSSQDRNRFPHEPPWHAGTARITCYSKEPGLTKTHSKSAQSNGSLAALKIRWRFCELWSSTGKVVAQ